MRIVVLALLMAAFPAHPAEVPAVELTAEPSHHLAFENKYVRVFHQELSPNAATLKHRHRHDYFAVTLGAAEISNQVEGKPVVTVKLRDGETIFADGNFVHVVRNLSAMPFRNVAIEYLQDAQAHKIPPPPWDEDRGLQVLDRGTEEILFVKDGVRASEFDLQPGGMVPKTPHAGPQLLVAITDVNLRSHAPGQAAVTITLKAGDIKWLPAGFMHPVMNVANPAKFVTLEFH